MTIEQTSLPPNRFTMFKAESKRKINHVVQTVFHKINIIEIDM